MPNLYCLDVTKQMLSWIWGDILGQEIPTLHDPYIHIQYYCTCMIVLPYNMIQACIIPSLLTSLQNVLIFNK